MAPEYCGDDLQKDPDITVPLHGGMALILLCNVTSYNVNYSYYNSTIDNITKTVANGTLSWLFNSLLGPTAGSQLSLEQIVDTAFSKANTAAEIANTWATAYSKMAVSILASIHDGHPNLAENVSQASIVTKISRPAFLALVILNAIFALLGLWLGVWAFLIDSSSVSAIAGGLSVEGMVPSVFESKAPMSEGKDAAKWFSENTGGERSSVGVAEVTGGQWAFRRTQSVETEVEKVLLPKSSSG